MTRTLLGLSFLLVSCFGAVASPQKLAFERGTGIWIANLDGTDAKKITKGSAPDISPDGTRIAFHMDESTNKDVTRHIAIADVATKKVTVFTKDIPRDKCQRAVWSPDGSHILFEIWTENDWHLAMINADGSGFRYVKIAQSSQKTLFSACWAPDGRSIYAQDFEFLYLFGLDGSELKHWNLKSLLPEFSLNGASNISLSPDGKTVLADAESETEAVNVPDWDGLAQSVWTIDLALGKAERLTPKGMMAWHACWLSPSRILFTSQSAAEKQPTIHEMSLPEKRSKLLLKNAQNPSAPRQP